VGEPNTVCLLFVNFGSRGQLLAHARSLFFPPKSLLAKIIGPLSFLFCQIGGGAIAVQINVSLDPQNASLSIVVARVRADLASLNPLPNMESWDRCRRRGK